MKAEVFQADELLHLKKKKIDMRRFTTKLLACK